MPDPKRVKLYFSDPVELSSEDPGENNDDSRDVIEISDDSDNDPESDRDEDEDEDDDNVDGVESFEAWKNYGAAKQVCLLLNKAEGCIADFAFSKSFSSTPNPGLSVAGIGLIRLPVSPDDAEKLYTSGTVSPGVAEVEGSKVEFLNPTWNTWLKDATDTITLGLGLDENKMRTTANLEKLIVYKAEAMQGTTTFNWHAGKDVKHVTEQIYNGYKITLVYNLRTKTPFKALASQIKGAAALISAVRNLKAANDPVAYVLQDEYSDSALSSQSFKGLDRFIVRNMVQAAQKVGGLSVYCGRLETTDNKELEPSSYGYGYEESEADLSEIDDWDFQNQHIDYLSHELENMVHIHGPVRVFVRGHANWEGPILTFGNRLADLSPYDTEMEGNEWEEDCLEVQRSYRSSCIVIYPTSPVQSLNEQAKVENVKWKAIKEILDSCEKGQIDGPFRKVLCQGILKGCLKQSFSDNDIAEAAEVMEESLEDLPQPARAAIFQNFTYPVLTLNSAYQSWENVQALDLAERRRNGCLKDDDLYTFLTQLFKLMKLFPVALRTLFFPMLKDIFSQPAFLSNGFAPLVRGVFDLINWQPVSFLLSLLRLIFIANPSENLRLQIEEDIKRSLASDSSAQEFWNEVSGNCHEFIIQGIKQRTQILLSDNKYADYGTPEQVVGYSIPKTQPRKLPPGLAPDPDSSSDEALQGDDSPDGVSTKAAQLRDYFLCIQGLPDTAYLTQHFLEAMQLPEPRHLPAYNVNYLRESDLAEVPLDIATLLPIATEVHKIISESPTERADLAALGKFMEYFKKLVFTAHPCIKPPAVTHMSLPPLNQQACPKRGCFLCAPLNDFLVSPTVQHFEMESAHGFKAHFKEVDHSLSRYSSQNRIDHTCRGAYRSTNVVLTVDKELASQYARKMKIFARDVAERQRVLGRIGIIINDDGAIASESVNSKLGGSGRPGKKRKATKSMG
ncbi:hypothetical protein ABW21_db0207279 [Orbilia brochopaga]|nr:hypothetical protein ABW21_db0207279 [Drechslerella brochopaga]